MQKDGLMIFKKLFIFSLSIVLFTILLGKFLKSEFSQRSGVISAEVQPIANNLIGSDIIVEIVKKKKGSGGRLIHVFPAPGRKPT